MEETELWPLSTVVWRISFDSDGSMAVLGGYIQDVVSPRARGQVRGRPSRVRRRAWGLVGGYIGGRPCEWVFGVNSAHGAM